MKNLLPILFILLILSSCKSEIELDSLNKLEYTFEQLPHSLKEIYQSKDNESNDSIQYFVLSLDEKISLEHYWTGLNKKLISKGFNHHFIINDKEFKLRANKGDPFILYNKKLYYTEELNLTNSNYKHAKYIEIDLIEYLSEY